MTEEVAEPEVTAEPVTEEVTEPEVTAEPVVEEVTEPAVDEVVLPVVTVNEDGSTTVVTETANVTVTLDETGAIATIKAIVNETEVVDAFTAQFVGKLLPLDAAAIALDDTGVAQAIIDALNVLATPVEAAA